MPLSAGIIPFVRRCHPFCSQMPCRCIARSARLVKEHRRMFRSTKPGCSEHDGWSEPGSSEPGSSETEDSEHGHYEAARARKSCYTKMMVLTNMVVEKYSERYILELNRFRCHTIVCRCHAIVCRCHPYCMQMSSLLFADVMQMYRQICQTGERTPTNV